MRAEWLQCNAITAQVLVLSPIQTPRAYIPYLKQFRQFKHCAVKYEGREQAVMTAKIKCIEFDCHFYSYMLGVVQEPGTAYRFTGMEVFYNT
jgi:hypothetical protein